MGILIPLIAIFIGSLAGAPSTDAPQFRIDTLDGRSIVGSVNESDCRAIGRQNRQRPAGAEVVRGSHAQSRGETRRGHGAHAL